MAKKGLSFTKFPSLHELEIRHSVDLGPAYKTDVSARSFTHFESQHQQLFSRMSSDLHLFSFQTDGATDAGNFEDKFSFA